MKYLYVLFVTFLIIGSTKFAYADVVINEIAWMGTQTSANDEWIELYNSGSSSVSLDGWTLNASDGSPSIDLIGTISANGYYLLERTDDTTVPGISAGVIYSGSLSNTGETLILKDNNEIVIDTVNMTSGWSAGDSTTKDTMQKSSGSWITATPTPGVINASVPTNSGSGSGNSGSSSSGSTSGTGSGTQTTSTINTVIKQKTEQEYWQDYVKQLDPDPKYSARMIIPDNIIEHVPVKFSAVAKKFDVVTVLEGKYEWSMGDGKSYIFNQNTPITYTYQQPGEYVVIMKYYSSIFKETPDSIHQKTIIVIPAQVKTVVDIPTGNISLTNNSTDDIDLYHWKLKTFTGSSFTFSTSTILRKDSSIIITPHVHRLPYVSNKGIQLFTPDDHNVPNNGIMPDTSILQNSYKTYTASKISEDTDMFSNENNQQDFDENFQESLYQIPQTASITPFVNSTSKKLIVLIVLFIIGIFLAVLGFNKILSISNNHKTSS